MQSDFSDILPNCLKNRFTTVPSFVPVSNPVCGSNLKKQIENIIEKITQMAVRVSLT